MNARAIAQRNSNGRQPVVARRAVVASPDEAGVAGSVPSPARLVENPVEPSGVVCEPVQGIVGLPQLAQDRFSLLLRTPREIGASDARPRHVKECVRFPIRHTRPDHCHIRRHRAHPFTLGELRRLRCDDPRGVLGGDLRQGLTEVAVVSAQVPHVIKRTRGTCKASAARSLGLVSSSKRWRTNDPARSRRRTVGGGSPSLWRQCRHWSRPGRILIGRSDRCVSGQRLFVAQTARSLHRGDSVRLQSYFHRPDQPVLRSQVLRNASASRPARCRQPPCSNRRPRNPTFRD